MNQDELKSDTDSINKKIFSRLRDEYGDKATDFIPLITLIQQFSGSPSFLKDASGFDDISDFIAVIRFALYFHNAGYFVEFVPRSKEKTPDLFVTKSKFRGFVEIKHIHKKHDGPRIIQINNSEIDEKLEQYGNNIRDEKYCRDEIIEGFKQIRNFSGLQNEDWMIVAVWNSDDDLDEINIKSSLNLLLEEKSEFENMPNPKCLIYGSDWYSFRKDTQFHVFRF